MLILLFLQLTWMVVSQPFYPPVDPNECMQRKCLHSTDLLTANYAVGGYERIVNIYSGPNLNSAKIGDLTYGQHIPQICYTEGDVAYGSNRWAYLCIDQPCCNFGFAPRNQFYCNGCNAPHCPF
eukprot:TRINITY_DN42142_c0_g1_i1.p3 TRINITY_DN42142_c0_g1~~TRINITY_DN42142_c0_g1_i1.p3  ORF type:complete len:139 (-),score=6.69 TRINITY_DN42142_c0_g1_i1:414-785(-)